MKQIILSNLKENVSLAEYTTFRIGGPARYFFVAKTPDDFLEALSWAKENKLKYFILGGGSNLLVSDQGFDGLVIKDENIHFKIEGTEVIAGSGLNLGYLVSQCAESGLSGVEFLSGIPGTVGGAVRGNAGAFGCGIGDLVDKVLIFDGKKEKSLNRNECAFVYRGSVIKEKNYIVLEVKLKLTKTLSEDVYTNIRQCLEKRNRRQPPTKPSAGCVFKNIDLKDLNIKKVKDGLDLTDEEFDEITRGGALPIGYVIDHLGLAGKKIGGAEVAPEHANYIVNAGEATADDVVKLISFIKQQVGDAIGVQLEEEVQYLGF